MTRAEVTLVDDEDNIDAKIDHAFGIDRNHKPRSKMNARQRVAERVLERDDHRCQECGSTEGLTIHHLIPQRESGTNKLCNLVTLCGVCHLKRHPERIGIKIKNP